MRKRSLSQYRINILNFVLALLALLISVPAAVHSISQLNREREQFRISKVITYSPNVSNFANSKEAGCWLSIASTRADAARCSYDNLIEDPCFTLIDYSNFEKRYFFCPKDGTGNDGTLLSMDLIASNEALRSAKESYEGEKYPWFITLDSKQECRLFTGTVEASFDKEGNIYGCSKGKYVSVSGPLTQKDGKYYLSCKASTMPAYSSCFVDTAVF